MSSYNLAAIKIVYGALYQDEEFPGIEQAIKRIKSNRIDSEQLFAYALAISGNKICGNYYKVLSDQLRNVILERDMIRNSVILKGTNNELARLFRIQ